VRAIFLPGNSGRISGGEALAMGIPFLGSNTFYHRLVPGDYRAAPIISWAVALLSIRCADWL